MAVVKGMGQIQVAPQCEHGFSRSTKGIKRCPTVKKSSPKLIPHNQKFLMNLLMKISKIECHF